METKMVMSFMPLWGYGIGGSLIGDQPMPSSPTWNDTFVHVMDPNLYTGTADVYLGRVFFDQNEYPCWWKTLKTTTAVAPPVGTLQVWVNGTLRSGSTVYVSRNYPFDVKASLAPNGFAGTQADWWFAAAYHGVLYYYVNGTWTTSVAPTWQKPVANMNQTQIWSSAIARGDSVTFYAGVDLARNGILDNPYHYTYVTVIGL